MTINELIPSVKSLSQPEKLALLQVLVQELVEAQAETNRSAPASAITSLDNADQPLTLSDRRAFLNLPLAERQRIMTKQAEAMQSHYNQNSDWKDLMAGDIIDY